MPTREMITCKQCGRVVSRVYSIGPTRVTTRHKCPHGEWCVGSNRLIAQHANHVSPQACPKCYAERKHL